MYGVRAIAGEAFTSKDLDHHCSELERLSREEGKSPPSCCLYSFEGRWEAEKQTCDRDSKIASEMGVLRP